MQKTAKTPETPIFFQTLYHHAPLFLLLDELVSISLQTSLPSRAHQQVHTTMDFQVIRPRRAVRGRDYDSAQREAIRAEDHVPKLDDLRMNLFADASPVSKCGIGGVGICYGRWLPSQPICMGNAISYVVPRVKDANECEIVALADATLEVIDQIQENIQIMTENNWKTSVTIWSDSQTALKFLEDPRQFQRFGPGRPAQVRNLILKLLSEMKNLPIKDPVKFVWIPGLSTGMHRGADHMTKNETVKSGKANISRAMKMLFPKKTVVPRVALQSAVSGTQDSKVTTKKTSQTEEKKEKIIEGGTVRKDFEEGRPSHEKKLKRSVPLDDEIDSDRPRKTMRLAKDTPAMGTDKENSQKNSCGPSAFRALMAAPLSTNISSRIDVARKPQHWSTYFGDCPEYAKSLAIYNFIKSSSCVDSFAKVMQQARSLRRGKLGLRALVESAVNEQVRANEQLVGPAQSLRDKRFGSQVDSAAACFPPVTWSIVQATVGKLPELQRGEMQEAIAQQLKVNRRQAIDRASLFYEPAQWD